MDRRRALKLLGLGALSPGVVSVSANPSDPPSTFRHGVAAGDPTQERLIIWTRVTPARPGWRGEVGWIVAEDPALKRVAASGTAEAAPERDFTVKVDVGGLEPGRTYWYRFQVGQHASAVGRARTLPAGPTQKLVLAVVSCAHFQCGLFNAYDAVARLARVDAVIHLGDYIYEEADGASSFSARRGRELGRYMQPKTELRTLQDYRARHALYRTDPDLKAAHARAAWICQWDDHESANDCWTGGSEKPDGPWGARKAAAMRAYYEWMPIREPAPGRPLEAINRSFQFGDLMTLIMMETRLIARAHQLSYVHGMPKLEMPDGRKVPDMTGFRARLSDPARQMLGAQQEAWVAGELDRSVQSNTTWQVLGSGVVMAPVTAPDVRSILGDAVADLVLATLPAHRRAEVGNMAEVFAYGAPYNLDAWDGYPAARARLYAALTASGARPIVISGDSHAFWANDLIDGDGRQAAVEFGTTSITSPGICDFAPALPINRFLQDANPHVRFTDHGAKGFLKLTLSHGGAVGELVAVSTVRARPYQLRVLKRFETAPAPGGGVQPLVEA